MNHVIVKLRTRDKNNSLKKLISNITLYELSQGLDSYVPYSPDHNLDEDSWFGISEFSNHSYSIPLINDEFESVEYDMLKAEDFD